MFPAFRAKTTAILIDDEKDFLDDICEFLPPTHNLLQYQNPKLALEAINNNQAQCKNFPFKTIDTLWHNFKEFRFGELISVAIIDYRMLPIDGMKLCRSITAPFIKRIMLTSQADEKLAIDALNNKIIDAFIKKTEPNLVEILEKTMAECTKQFFCDLSNWLRNYKDNHNPLLTPKGDEFLSRIYEEKAIRQYCCFHDFNTMWLQGIDNQEHFLTMYSDETLEELLSNEQSQHASAKIITEISQKKAAPCFPWNNNPLMPNGKDWAAFMKPLVRIDSHLYGAIS